MLRFGLVGFGNIGKLYAGLFANDKVSGGQLAAVCNRRPPQAELPEGVRYFDDVDDMLDASLVDAVIVATPHPSHLEIGEKVLRKGLHLMMEKPLAATKLESERLLAIPRQDGQQFGVMLNLRTHPQMQRLRQLVNDGELGSLQRVHWTITNWFRSEAYYASSEWRATWKHEGGGVLINQGLHNLDLLQWICGMPSSLLATCRFGADHDIEVEDRVTAILDFPNGAGGVFATSTGEAPGVNRLEIAGTRGLAVLQDDALTLLRNETDADEFSRTTDSAFGSPATECEIYPAGEAFPSHAGILTNFVAAVSGEAELMVDAAEGLNSVELANAMVYSAWKGAKIELPLSSSDYEAALVEKIAISPARPRTVRVVKADLDESWS